MFYAFNTKSIITKCFEVENKEEYKHTFHQYLNLLDNYVPWNIDTAHEEIQKYVDYLGAKSKEEMLRYMWEK